MLKCLSELCGTGKTAVVESSGDSVKREINDIARELKRSFEPLITTKTQ